MFTASSNSRFISLRPGHACFFHLLCEEVQSSMNRVRRDIDEVDPVFGDDCPRSFPKRLELVCADEALQLRLHRGRWYKLDEECPQLKRRQTSAKLFARGNHVGSFRMSEYELGALADGDEFYYLADCVSSSMAELAAVLRAHWEELHEITDYGKVVELERGWMSPRYPNGKWFAAAWLALAELAQDRSLLVLKAYPLEYEGNVTEQNADALTRRQKALIRYYQSSLSVAPLPGATGQRGWMYSIPDRLLELVPPPLEKPLKLDHHVWQ